MSDDPLGRFASTATTDYPRAADPKQEAAWLANWMRDKPEFEVALLTDLPSASPAVRKAARRELARREAER